MASYRHDPQTSSSSSSKQQPAVGPAAQSNLMKRITFKTLPSGGNIKTWRACGAGRACPGVRFTPLFIYNRTSPLAAPDITPGTHSIPSRRSVRPFDVIKCKCSSPPPVTLTTVLTTPGRTSSSTSGRKTANYRANATDTLAKTWTSGGKKPKIIPGRR